MIDPILITILYTLILLIPGYFIVKLIISFCFTDIKQTIKYILLCCICYVIYYILNLNDTFKILKSKVIYFNK